MGSMGSLDMVDACRTAVLMPLSIVDQSDGDRSISLIPISHMMYSHDVAWGPRRMPRPK